MLNGLSENVIAGGLSRRVAGALTRARPGAIQWLIVSAAILVIAIMIGTGHFALEYRERTLEVPSANSTTVRCCCPGISTSN